MAKFLLALFNNVGKPLPMAVIADNVLNAFMPFWAMDEDAEVFFIVLFCICEEYIVRLLEVGGP